MFWLNACAPRVSTITCTGSPTCAGQVSSMASTPAEIDLATVQTNIVIFRLPAGLPDAATVVRRAQEKGVLVSAFAERTVRATTHLNVDAAQCRHAAAVLARAVEA